MKNVIPFRGVGIPSIRQHLKIWYQTNAIHSMSVEKQFQLAIMFFEQTYAEDKLAGILFLQLYLINKIDYQKVLPKFEYLFKKGLIFDWNICDWFCVRVLGPMIKSHGEECAHQISVWHKAENIWQAHCSVVVFINFSSNEEYYSMIEKSARKLIKRPERFAKTAVGWILREFSKTDKRFTVSFIQKNSAHFSKESLKNALKYFDNSVKLLYLQKFNS